MTQTCCACRTPKEDCRESSGGPLCPECLARALMSPAARKKADAEGRKAARQEAKANLGMPTEQRVLECAARLRSLGIRLDKVPTPWKVVGSSGPFKRCIQAEQAIVDFVGHDEHGRALAIEVKSVGTPDARFYVRNVRPQQREYLDCATASGAGAFLLVDFPPKDAWYLVPWDVARDMTRIAPEDGIDAYRADRDWLLVQPMGAGRAA